MENGLSHRPTRLFEIDRAKGFAILLVVFGHLVMRDQPEGMAAGIYDALRTIVYKFHMPFFMYLTGIVLFYTGAHKVTKSEYPSFISKKAFRLLVPFILLGSIIYFGKMAASHVMHVENSGLSILDGFKAMIWDTHRSPATSIWYVFAAFIYFLITPPLLWISKGNLIPLLVLGAVMYVLPVGEYFYADKICHFYIFFLLGGWAALNFDRYKEFMNRYSIPLLAAFVVSWAILLVDIHWLIQMAIIGTLSLPAVHSLIRRKPLNKSDLLLFLGKFAFVIYLFNTIFIGVTKGVMLKLISWDGMNFLLFVPVLFAAGVIGPILLKIIVFRRIKFLDRITN